MATDDYLFLFGDLIGSTEVASEASPTIYSKLYTASFHLAVDCAKKYIRIKGLFPAADFSKTLDKVSVSGDEVYSFFKITDLTGAEKIDLIASAVSFAFVLKVFWMASPYNLLRLNERKFPRDISIGIHSGPAERITDAANSDIAGLHINVTKRLETLGRSGSHSRILVSDDIAYNFMAWLREKRKVDIRESPPIFFTCFELIKTPLDLKGIPVKVTPFELQMDVKNDKAYQLFSLIKDTPGTNDARAEEAASVLGNTLFTTLERIESLRQIIGSLASPLNYIDKWFDSINPIPRLFFNDLWTEMIAFFFSCGFARYKTLTAQSKAKYEIITESLYLKLVATFNQLKNQSRND